jgi:16S rRNA processing protein RimM
LTGKADSRSNKNDRRGLVESSTEPRFLVIGKILKAHGVRGEVRVLLHTDLPERFTWLEEVYVGERDPKPMTVEGVRFHKDLVLLKLAGVDYRDQVDAIKGELLQVPIENAIPLDEDEYFLFQLVGLDVYTEEGEHLGKLKDVIETGANNVFVVKGEGKKDILLPDTKEVITEIDFENGRLTVHLLPGLLP